LILVKIAVKLAGDYQILTALATQVSDSCQNSLSTQVVTPEVLGVAEQRVPI